MPQAPAFAKDLTFYLIYDLLIAAIGPLLFGYHLAELNAPQEVITCQKTSSSSLTTTSLSSLPQCIHMESLEIGVVSSIMTVGGLIGALAAGTAASKLGRLRTMRYNTVFFAIGPVLEALAPSVAVMAVGRFISGLGAGAATVVVPIYISEVSPPKQKGAFGSLTQIMINVGILLAQLLGLFLSKGQLWRIILGVGGIIGVIQFAGLVFCVESPKWHADHGLPTQGRKDLRKLRGEDYDIQEEVEGWGIEEQGEMEGEEQALLHDRDHPGPTRNASHPKQAVENESVSIFKVLTDKHYNRAVFTVIVIMVAQQLCGINSIVMYGVSLLSELLSSSSALLNLFVALLNLVVTSACAPLVDKLGRKLCLGASAGGMALSSLLLAIGISRSIPVLSGIAVMAFVASFALGVGPVPFILSSELVGPEAVGATQSWALAANWLATFVVAQFFPVVNKALGKGRIYYVFAGFGLATLLFVYFVVPETKGKRDADEVWGRERRRED